MIADKDHPYAQGHLCARGYGYADIAYSKDRLTDPLKKNDKGAFEAVSWEQAYAEIAEKVKSIIDSSGPEALAIVQDPRPSGKYYSKRFMNALGSPNVYTHGAACNLSKNSGFTQVIGAGDYVSDVENSKMTMFIGRSYADAIRPSSVHALQKAHDNGAQIVLVDPRCNNSIAFADEWVPINPGTDLALVLAMSNVLISNGLYDQGVRRRQRGGLRGVGRGHQDHTRGVGRRRHRRPVRHHRASGHLVRRSRPLAASIEPSWRGAFGCSYENSGETARAVCCFNTLLGCWNQEGGALLPSVSAGDVDEEKFPSVPKVEAKIAGTEEYPLALSSMGVNLFAGRPGQERRDQGHVLLQLEHGRRLFEHGVPGRCAISARPHGGRGRADVRDGHAGRLRAARYELPRATRAAGVHIGGKVPAVALRDQVLEKIHPNTRPVDQIFGELAEACGVGEYFRFGVDELADAQLRTVGLSLDTLRRTGTAYFPEKEFSYGTAPKWKTPTEKVQFSSEACEKAGLSPCPVWVEPAVMPMGDELRLIGGKQAIHSHTQTANIEDLMQITKDYDLTRVWLNADEAARRGIADGDEVEVSNGEHTGRAQEG